MYSTWYLHLLFINLCTNISTIKNHGACTCRPKDGKHGQFCQEIWQKEFRAWNASVGRGNRWALFNSYNVFNMAFTPLYHFKTAQSRKKKRPLAISKKSRIVSPANKSDERNFMPETLQLAAIAGEHCLTVTTW